MSNDAKSTRDDAPAGAPKRCAICAVRETSVCALCDAKELGELDAANFTRQFAAGQEILGAGTPVAFVGSVISGVVRLTRTMADGRRQIVGLLFPGDFIGRAALGVSDYDAVAASDVTLCAFRRTQFEALLRATPHLERRRLSMTLDELDAAREQLLLLGRKSAREKVASFLALFARRLGHDEEADDGVTRVFEIPLNRDEIGDCLGLTIETVSRQISRLRREAIIEVARNREFRVLDLQALLEETGDDSDGGILS
ncbi:MAG: cyclic nucleotide-binding domain-containing protein [Pseudomonadota bacterium]